MLNTILEEMGRVEERTNKRFDAIDQRFDRIDKQLDVLQNSIFIQL